MKWTYVAQGFDGFETDTLNAGCDIDMRWKNIRRVEFDLDSVSFKGGAISNTFRFALASSYNSDGTPSYVYNSCFMTFKNGILINCGLPT